MGVLITNENDVTTHQGFAVLPDKNNPVHNALFTQGTRRSPAEWARRGSRVPDLAAGPGQALLERLSSTDSIRP